MLLPASPSSNAGEHSNPASAAIDAILPSDSCHAHSSRCQTETYHVSIAISPDISLSAATIRLPHRLGLELRTAGVTAVKSSRHHGFVQAILPAQLCSV